MPRPSCLTPGMTWYQFYRRLGGPQVHSGWERKISPAPGFDRWTIQPNRVAVLTTLSEPIDLLQGLKYTFQDKLQYLRMQ